MPPSIWDVIALVGNKDAALSERGAALSQVLRMDRLLEAGRTVGTTPDLTSTSAILGSHDFNYVAKRYLRCSDAERSTILTSLRAYVTLFAARQAEGAGHIEAMQRLTLQAVGLLRDIEYDLRLMYALETPEAIPTEGKKLIAVADVKGVLHFRIFDREGKRIVETDASKLAHQAGPIKALRDRLVKWHQRHDLSPSEKQQVITEVTSIVGHTQLQNVFAGGGGLTVASVLDSLGERGYQVGALRDVLGVRRDIVRPARVAVLFCEEIQSVGRVAWLRVEAVALGPGHSTLVFVDRIQYPQPLG